jgi:phosphotransferase system enzyme I (PtsI)
MATMLLLGLGKLDDLSMEPHSVPKVKKIIRTIRLEEAKTLADNVLEMKCPDKIEAFITHEMMSRFPEDFDRDLSFEEKSVSSENDQHVI